MASWLDAGTLMTAPGLQGREAACWTTPVNGGVTATPGANPLTLTADPGIHSGPSSSGQRLAETQKCESPSRRRPVQANPHPESRPRSHGGWARIYLLAEVSHGPEYPNWKASCTMAATRLLHHPFSPPAADIQYPATPEASSR